MADRKVANLEGLKASGRTLPFVWLSDLEGVERIREALGGEWVEVEGGRELVGGDACIVGYTVAHWNTWDESHQRIASDGTRSKDMAAAQLHQFCFVLRTTEPPAEEYLFPVVRESFDWVKDNVPYHVFTKVIQISDQLAGWDIGQNPFAPIRRKGELLPASGGGASSDFTALLQKLIFSQGS